MTTLIKIGNSQGVRIPKSIIEQAHLEGKALAFKVVETGLLIQPVKKPREGWKDIFEQAPKSKAIEQQDQEWLDAPLSSDEDWEW